jgi:hypothetical protein
MLECQHLSIASPQRVLIIIRPAARSKKACLYPLLYLTYGVIHLASPDNHLHLEDVALGNTGGHQVLQDLLLVEAEGAGEVGGSRAQQHLRHIVCAAGDHLPLQVPPVHSCINSAVNRPANSEYTPTRNFSRISDSGPAPNVGTFQTGIRTVLFELSFTHFALDRIF